MKLWCQSGGALGKDPLWHDYENGLRERAKEVIRPDTVVELHGLDATITGIDRFRASQTPCTIPTIKNAIRAQNEVYDAFVLISTFDTAYYEVRELIDIPVVFMLENSLHLAMTLASRFALSDSSHETPYTDG